MGTRSENIVRWGVFTNMLSTYYHTFNLVLNVVADVVVADVALAEMSA